MNSIPFENLLVKAHDLWMNKWMVLTAGDFEKRSFNAMTVSWGSLGVMWEKPFVQVVVRPSRYTFKYMEEYDTFTLCAFPAKYHRALQILGSRSGRDIDKIAETELSPKVSTKVAAPSFSEAELVFECRKMYWDDLEPAQFLDPDIEKNYPQNNYHRVYFGKVLAILGSATYTV